MATDAPTQNISPSMARFIEQRQARQREAELERLGTSLIEGMGVSDDAQAVVREMQPARQVAEHPATARTLSRPEVAEVGGEDWRHLNFIERGLGEISQRFERGALGVQLSHLGSDALFGEDDDGRELQIQAIQQQQALLNRDFGIPDEGVPGFFAGIPGATAEMLPQLAETVVAGAEGGAVGAAGGAAVGAAGSGGPGAIPGAVAGFPIGAALGTVMNAARSEAGHAFIELREVTGDDGAPIDPDVARAFSLGVGAMSGAIERLALGSLVKDVPGVNKVISAIGTEGAKKALKNATVRRLATSFVRGAATEGLTEALQEGIGVGAELSELYLVGKSLDDFSVDIDGEKLTGSDAVWARVISAMVQGAQAGAGISTAGTSIGVAAESRAVENAVETAKWLSGVSDAAVASRLRKENAEAFKEHIESSGNDAAESIEIEPNVVHEWLDEIASPEESRQMIESVEAFREQAARVEDFGGPYVVPMSDYLTFIAPSSMRAEAEANSRVEPAAMTKFEAELVQEERAREAERDVPESDVTTGQPVSEPETMQQVIDAERLLSEEVGEVAPSFAEVRASANATVESMRVRDLSPHRYRVQAAKEARLANQAIKDGDTATAAIHKRRQLFNSLAEQAARKQREETKRVARFAASLQTRASMERRGKAGADYSEQVDSLLDRFDMRLSTTLTQIDKRLSLREFIIEQQATGESVIIPNRLVDEAFTKSWKSMKVSELRELGDALANIEQIARRKTNLLYARNEKEVEAARAELVEAASRNLKVKQGTADLNPGMVAQLKDQLLSAHMTMRKMEFIVDQLDGGDPKGPWREYVFTPLAKAEAERNDLNAEYTMQFMEITGELMKGKGKEYKVKKLIPEFGLRMSKQDLLSILLNTGNESNFTKLADGYGWDSQVIESVLLRELGEADYRYAQRVWDMIETLWPRIEQQEKSLSGVVPPKVEARHFENEHGKFRGGYYPVVYDPNKSRTQFKNADRGLYQDMEVSFRRPITGHGFTETRTEAVGPIKLDLAVIPRHLDEVIHDLTHRDVLMQIDGLLENGGIESAVNDTLGKEAYRLFRPWLQGIATDRVVQDRGLDTVEKWLGMTRRNLTTFILGFRYTTLFAQVAGFSNGVAILNQHLPDSKKYLLRGMHKAYAGHGLLGMQAAWENAAKQSDDMRQRPGLIDRDARDVIRKHMGETTANAVVKRTAMQLIGKVQMLAVDLPIWYAAYEGGVESLNLSHEDAVIFADSMVRLSQGAAGAKDLSAIQRSSEGMKQLMLFFTWRNTLYNQLASTLSTVSTDGKQQHRISSMALMVMLPAIYSGLIRGAFDDAEDEWDLGSKILELTGGEMLGTLPLVDVMSGLAGAFGGRRFANETPTQDLINAFGDAGKETLDVITDEERDADMDMLLSIARLAGMASGAPLSQPLQILEDEIKED